MRSSASPDRAQVSPLSSERQMRRAKSVLTFDMPTATRSSPTLATAFSSWMPGRANPGPSTGVHVVPSSLHQAA